MDTASNTNVMPIKAKRVNVFQEFPAVSKDNFKVYHEPDGTIDVVQRNTMQKTSIYAATPDTPLEQKIVNEPKPQATLRYIDVRGKQFRLQAQKATNSAKKRRTQACVAKASL